MSQTASKTQVVIIGAGPTGLSLAAQLLRYNIDFIILEKSKHTTQLSKAIVVQARTLEILNELNLSDTAIARGQITTSLNMFYKGRKRASIHIAGLGKGQTDFPYALSLEQSKTETLFNEFLLQHNKQVLWNCEFLRSEEKEQGVTVYYKDAGGQENTIEALYLAGCEGAHSLVRHQMNVGFEGDTVPRLFYVADVMLKSQVINANELFIFVIEKGFVIFFPMEGQGHFRVIGILPDRQDDNFTFEEIEPLVKDMVQVPISFEEVRWFSTYKVHSRMASRFMKGRSFIAGDSAHIHTPAGGQGMNTGIQDAYNLAWKLAFVIQGKLKASVLETYSTERTGNAKHLLKTTDRMFDIMAGTNPIWNFVRLNILPPIANFASKNPLLNKFIFPLISQTGIAYPDSALTVESRVGKVKAGDRMPYFILPDRSTSYAQIKDPMFKLLYFGPGAPRANVLSDIKFPVKTIQISEVPKQLFGSATNFYILLRPDNHILYLGTEVSAGINALKRWSAA